MLKNINTLSPFFEDTTVEIGVREYARMNGITPPTASAHLKKMHDEGFLKRRGFRRSVLFSANTGSEIFDEFCILYHKLKIKDSGLTDYLKEKLLHPTIILFGSLSKAENTKESDIDLCLITKSKAEIDLSKFEKKLDREIQVFRHPSLKDIPNEHLVNNMINGRILSGLVKW